jgi:putative oligomerization/nucleic acid binding protein
MLNLPRNRRSCLTLILTLMMGLLGFSGCGGAIGHIMQTEGQDRYVRVEAQPHNGREGDRSFSHPVTLSATDWERTLSLIRVKPRTVPPFSSTKTEPELAFRQSELHYLAERLADAFPKAGSRDWIVFYLGLPHETGATEITSGAFFVEERRIHLLFANFRHLVTIPAVARQLKENPLHAAGAMVYEVVPGTSLTVLTENRWALSKPPLARVVEVMINEIPRDEETGLETKLRTLKHLREEGLISEDEYQRKREELLKAL